MKFLEDFGPGPGFFPVLLGLALLALGALYLVTLRKPVEDGAPSPFADRRLLARPLVVLLSLLAVALLFDRLGFLLTVFLWVALLLRFLEKYRAVTSVGLGLAFSLGFYLLFHAWLRMPLPRGWLERLLF